MEKYMSTDFYMACFLIVKGYSCQIEKGKKDFQFVFDKTDDIIEEKNKYFSGAEVSAINFKSAIRDLKSRMQNYEE